MVIMWLRKQPWEWFTKEDCEPWWVGKMDQEEFDLVWDAIIKTKEVEQVGSKWRLRG
jgi:hypothetical protein